MIPLCFLIDYENVHSAGLRGAELLTERDIAGPWSMSDQGNDETLEDYKV